MLNYFVLSKPESYLRTTRNSKMVTRFHIHIFRNIVNARVQKQFCKFSKWNNINTQKLIFVLVIKYNCFSVENCMFEIQLNSFLKVFKFDTGFRLSFSFSFLMKLIQSFSSIKMLLLVLFVKYIQFIIYSKKCSGPYPLT
jgi:hypothetical protein